MRLLFVLPEFGDRCPGGIATYYRQLIVALQRAGCRIDVICTGTIATTSSCGAETIRAPDPTDIAHQKARFAAFASMPQLHHQLALAYAAFEMAKDVDDYAAIEVSDWGSLYVPWCLQATSSPVIAALHGSPGQVHFQDPMAGHAVMDIVMRLLETVLLPRADMLHSCSRNNAAFWADLLGVPVMHIESPYQEALQPVEDGHSERGAVLARLQHWKGPDILLQALQSLGSRAPSIDWVGSSTLASDHKTPLSSILASKYPQQWGQCFHFRGGVLPHEANQFIRCASFVVHPSTWDVYPLACVEAMAAGKILVCSEGAGVSEIIDHGRNGFRFPNRDWQALAEALEEVTQLEQPRRTAIEAAARETIVLKHDPRWVVEKRLDLIASLKKTPRSSHPWFDSVFAGANRDDAASILDRIPLKVLAPYMASRVKHKVMG